MTDTTKLKIKVGWFYLALAILFGVSGTTSMKFSEGFTNLVPSFLMMFCYLISLSSATMALKRIDVSVVYSVWSGVGTVLIVIIGVVLFNESLNLLKILSISLIMLGVVGLNFSERFTVPRVPEKHLDE